MELYEHAATKMSVEDIPGAARGTTCRVMWFEKYDVGCTGWHTTPNSWLPTGAADRREPLLFQDGSAQTAHWREKPGIRTTIFEHR